MEKKHKIYMVGTTHFDPVWMWTWDEGMASIRSTFKSALKRMEEDPNFIYSFSCPAVFIWIKNVDNNLFKEIKKKVEEGRWELVEGWWNQPDCYNASGESYVRHGLYGQRFLEDNFGKKANSGFNTDSFGHNLMLPQILKKSGIDNYVFGRPSSNEQQLPAPLFLWESPDGSKVMAFRSGSEGANAYSLNVKKDLYALGNRLDELQSDLIMLYGVSNHGGAPTKKAISDINSVKSDEQKHFMVDFGSVNSFFEQQDQEKLPIVKDELMVDAFGVFSNNTEIKRNNRLAEYGLLNAEKFAVLAHLLTGKEYPEESLRSLWQDTLFNQFHDILGGASVKPAYFDARNLHGRVLQTTSEIINYSLQSITKNIDTSGKGFPLVVWNPNTFPVKTPIEAELQWAWEFDWYQGPLTITDSDGKQIPAQLIQENSVLPGFRSRFVFQDIIPALGYKVYYIQQKKQDELEFTNLQVSETILENKRYKLKICQKTGSVISVYDQKTNTEVLGNIAQPVVLEDKGDTWCFNISHFGDKVGTFKMESAKIIEDGPIRVVLRTKSTFLNSYLEQDFILYKDTDTIQGKFRVNWREKNKVLKLNFDSRINNPEVTSSIPYGSIVRDYQEKEFPTQEWIDLSKGNKGLSIITDSVFAYDIINSTVRLTLMRSPIYGHLTWKEKLDCNKDYNYVGQTWREGSWKIVLHKGSWQNAKIPEKAISFNNPVTTITEGNHSGELPAKNSFISLDSNSVIGMVLKQAENNQDLILRLFEYSGQKDNVDIRLNIINKKYQLSCKKHEIKTLRLVKDLDYQMTMVNNLEE